MSAWSPNDDEQLRTLARKGLSLTKISTQIGRSKGSTRNHAIRLKIPIAGDRNRTAQRLAQGRGY
jgi:hypothetical protein